MLDRIAVLGGGNIAHAVAAELSLTDHSVNLFELDRFKAGIEPTIKRGGIETTGILKGFAKLNIVTTDIKKAVKDVDIILICVPAYGVRTFSRLCIPNLEDGQTVIFFGKGGHTITFVKTMKELGIENKNITLGETHSAPYTARMKGPAQIEIMFRLDILAAALPARNTERLVAMLRKIFPLHYFAPAQNVLATLLCDFNAQMHPPWVLFNVARLGPRGEFFLTDECVSGQESPFSKMLVEAIERERLTIMQALGLKPIRISEISELAGRKHMSNKESNEDTYAWKARVKAKGLEKRYLAEDIPYGLVTISSLGDMIGVQTPAINSIITLASIIHRTNYWRIGRTVEELGISGLSVEELQKFVTEGTER